VELPDVKTGRLHRKRDPPEGIVFGVILMESSGCTDPDIVLGLDDGIRPV
jgi:hypothetical protein